MQGQEDEFRGWRLNRGADDDDLRKASAQVGRALPADYARVLRHTDGGEGYIRSRYLILWRTCELAMFNDDYDVATHAPGLLLFGSSGTGDAYGFDTRDGSMAVVAIPFVGMSWERAEPVAPEFAHAIRTLPEPSEAVHLLLGTQRRPLGREMTEVTPALFGGNAYDAKNWRWLNRQEHIDATRQWNEELRHLAARRTAG